MPIIDNMMTVHGFGGSGTNTSNVEPAAGLAIGHAASIEYSEGQLDFGLTYPRISCGGVPFGLHVLIMEAYAGNIASATIGIVHGASSTPATVLQSRTMVVAEMTLGNKIFIPMESMAQAVLGTADMRYLAAFWTSNATASAGKVCMWFGPPTGGSN
jgi:hypothetical protein